MTGSLVILLALGTLAVDVDGSEDAEADFQLNAPGVVESTRFTVRWLNEANARLGEMQYLEESRDGGRFYTVYSGLGGTKTFMNKKPGAYQYRVRWQFCFATYCHSVYSEPVNVTVRSKD